MKFKKKRGFTLVEAIVYIAIYTIISSIGIIILLNTRNIYYNTIDKRLASNSVNEAFITIDNIRKDSNEVLIDENSNTVSFKKKVNQTDFLLKIIQVEKQSVIIKYYTASSGNSLFYDTKNEIISDIDSFNVLQKGKLIYIKVSKKGREFIMCL